MTAGGRRALVVDDSSAMRIILGDILADLGFDTLEAQDGVVALETLEASPDLALALVDWNMPRLDGLALIKAVRSDPRWGALKLIVVTTETERSQMVRAIAAGADEYVMKPFTRDVIADKLKLLGLEA